MFHLGCPGDREHHGRFLEQPRERHLRRLCTESLGHSCERAAGFREISGREREPGNEADLFVCAVVKHVRGVPVHQVVLVLYRCDRDDATRRLNLGNAYLGQANVMDLAFLLKVFEQFELIVGRDLRIDAMQLKQVDALHA